VSHRNARLTPHGRLLLVRRVIDDRRPVAHVAKELGVSRQCAHRWVARFFAEGEPGLLDRSSRPHRSPTRTSAAIEEAVVELRRRHRRGQDWLGPELGLPARTVSRVLRRHQVPYLHECDPLTGEVIRATRHTYLRYERDHPGDLTHMDVKKMGRIPPGGGHKAHGRSEEVRGRGLGYDYIHSMVDDHSRYAYSEVLDDELGTTCAAFFLRAVADFAAHGITRITEVMTDNHLSYKRSHAMRDAVAQVGARQVFIQPFCPWQNGKVERLNLTIQTEWAYRQIFTTNQARTDALAPWLEHYNTQRRHSSLGGLPPISRLSPT
jgi:transposase InsO family protein